MAAPTEIRSRRSQLFWIGVLPRGAHVRRRTGWSIKPDSSMKTMLRPVLWAFFYMRPILPTPPFDGLFVPFPGPLLRLLATPPEGTQKMPHVLRVVAHAEMPFDHLGNSLARPEIGRISARTRAAEQNLHELFLLAGSQRRRTSRRRFRLQALHAVFPNHLLPTCYRGRRTPHRAGHIQRPHAAGQKLGGTQPACLQV